MSHARDALHHLVDALSDADVDAAKRVLEGLVMSTNDEIDDRDEQAIERGREAARAGASLPGEQVAARLRAKYG